MENENIIRLSVFFGLFVLFAAIETLAPRRPLTAGRGRRWITNWGMSIKYTHHTIDEHCPAPLGRGGGD